MDRWIDRQSQLNGQKGMCTEREMDTDRLTDKYDKKIDIQIRQIERKIDRWVDSKREWKMENKIGLDQSWRKRPVLLVGKKGQSVKPTNYCYRVYSHRCRKKRYRLGIAKSVYCTGRRSKIQKPGRFCLHRVCYWFPKKLQYRFGVLILKGISLILKHTRVIYVQVY